MFLNLPSNDLANEIANHHVAQVDASASVLDASRLMRESGATELVVTGVVNGALLAIGIVTARDIVTRVVAVGLDPEVLTAGDITWCGMVRPITGNADVDTMQRGREENRVVQATKNDGARPVNDIETR